MPYPPAAPSSRSRPDVVADVPVLAAALDGVVVHDPETGRLESIAPTTGTATWTTELPAGLSGPDREICRSMIGDGTLLLTGGVCPDPYAYPEEDAVEDTGVWLADLATGGLRPLSEGSVAGYDDRALAVAAPPGTDLGSSAVSLYELGN